MCLSTVISRLSVPMFGVDAPRLCARRSSRSLAGALPLTYQVQRTTRTGTVRRAGCARVWRRLVRVTGLIFEASQQTTLERHFAMPEIPRDTRRG